MNSFVGLKRAVWAMAVAILVRATTDAALRVPFTPGGITVHATGKGGGGIAIIELYESQ